MPDRAKSLTSEHFTDWEVLGLVRCNLFINRPAVRKTLPSLIHPLAE